MEGPRKPNPEELPHLSSFFNQQVPIQGNWSYFDEYPQVFHQRNRDNLRIIVNENEIIAHGATKNTVIKTPFHIFQITVLGSIFTHKDYRHQGHSRKIIESCIEHAKQSGSELMILWTDLVNFYQKFGFELAGTEISAELGDGFNFNEMSPGLQIKKNIKIDPQLILKIYQSHSVFSHRTVEDIKQLMTIPQARIYSAWNAQGVLQAFAVEGKGSDLQGYVHEWGGSVSALMPLFAQMKKDMGKVMVMCPKHAQNLTRKLESHGAKLHEGVLGMIKIINPKVFTKKIKRASRLKGLSDFVFDYRDGVYYFGRGDDVFQTPDDADIIRLAFGPLKASQIHDFPPQVKEVFEKVFPIPFWIWGWDSI